LVDVKAQKDKPDLQRLILTARSNDPDQKLRLHIELAYIPSYRNTPKILDFPPIQPVVSVEEPLEILADKVCALALRSYLKGRDLWDIYYLYKERSIDIKWELVQRKVHDNKIPVSELKERFEKVNVKIKDEGSSILVNELERFLPKHVLDQYRSSFDLILDTVVELVSHYDLDKME
jgi:predicted nucleotidyltransferase component of viral defense system